jgi:hypothetical protein
MNRILVAAGALMMLVGAVVLASVLLRSPAPTASTSAPVVVEKQERVEPPSRAWSIAAGGALAIGAALIGIGMNRWRAPRA